MPKLYDLQSARSMQRHTSSVCDVTDRASLYAGKTRAIAIQP